MLYEKIKNDYQFSRKLVPVDPISRDLLMSIVSELDSIFKQNGVVSYDDALAVIKKFLKLNHEFQNLATDADTISKLKTEEMVLVSYMPAQLDSPTMATIVGSLILNNTNTMQLIMKFFKENYNGMYDAKSLSSIVKAALSKP